MTKVVLKWVSTKNNNIILISRTGEKFPYRICPTIQEMFYNNDIRRGDCLVLHKEQENEIDFVYYLVANKGNPEKTYK